jgi:preprotein translocase subunit SecE
VARDRKRAKQRQQRRERRAPGTGPAGLPAAAPEPDAEQTDAPNPIAHATAALGRPELTSAGEDLSLEAEEAELEDEREHPGVAAKTPAPREGSRITNFLRGSWRELQRVQWPDRRQVAQATGVVLVFVILAGVYLGVADYVFGQLVDAII